MFSVDKTAKFSPNPTSTKPYRPLKKQENVTQVSPKRDKSFEKYKRSLEPSNEQNSFLSKDTSSKRKIKAIVTLNIEDECEKLIIYEEQDIYELAANITRKYKLPKDFTNYITENIDRQIQEHSKTKGKGLNEANKFENTKKEDSSTPKFKRENNFHFENLNTSKSLERVSKSPRQRTTSPNKRDDFSNIKTKKTLKDSGFLAQNSKIQNLEHSKNRETSQNREKLINRDAFQNTNNKRKKQQEFPETNKFSSTTSKGKNLDNSRLLATNESFNESFRKIKPSLSKERQGLSPSRKNNKFKHTVLVSKDLKIIENNIIFLPSNFLTSKNEERKKDKSINKAQKTYDNSKSDKINTSLATNTKLDPSRPDPNYSDRFLIDLQDIFQNLDDDEDGYISSHNIDLMKVDPRILDVIQDILIEMDEKEEVLNFGGFLNKIEEYRLEVKIHDFFRENDKNKKNQASNPKHSSV